MMRPSPVGSQLITKERRKATCRRPSPKLSFKRVVCEICEQANLNFSIGVYGVFCPCRVCAYDWKFCFSLRSLHRGVRLEGQHLQVRIVISQVFQWQFTCFGGPFVQRVITVQFR
ncbi:hypothetical protein GOP47_0013742 [Adiantum capillus-veneris]|uniref:Uncharacterized protein n=1 Tax=Adiantum capillus-veneris TaxID=13818 RepID=A0A9D4UPT5_ADICA|nr:hypothetical protein GOP47_0013742 [Adiantum capillus-veneris]